MNIKWEKHIKETAEEYDLPYDVAFALFELLGESEAYDGFITACQDAEGFYDDI